MSSITTWTRLEARTRSGDMRPSLEARVHDPLWLLGRQWQLGEFQGEDAGSPVSVRARGDAAPLTTFQPGDGPAVPYDAGTPLEALVEREPPGPPDRRLAAEGGAHFLRRLAAAGMQRHAGAYVAAYPLVVPDGVDAASRRYVALMAGRVPDGAALRAAFPGAGLPVRPTIPAADRAPVLAALTAWRTWFDGLAGPPASSAAWRSDRMEYRFALASPAGVTLSAEEYSGGRLDWSSFDAEAGGLAAEPGASETITQTTLPAPVRYAGMPAARWWQFEDARVDFGGLETAPEDLARMLVAEFASLYSNDWYLMPIDLPVGSLAKIASLVVTDAFNERTLILAAPATGGWSLFRLSAGGARHERLLLAPTVGAALEGEALEEVLLLRDEMANMAWAVERRVQTAAGRSRERAEETNAAPTSNGDGWEPAAELAYQLMSSVPEHWIPLLPEEISPGAMQLRRGAMERLRDGTLEPILPVGRLLEPGSELVLHEEEVPRAGARVTRTPQYARWTNGSAHLWTGRRKQPGRGEGSSGLRFDAVIPAEAEPVAYDAEAVEQHWYADALGRRRLDARALPPGARAWCVLRVANRGAATWRRESVSLGVLLPRGGPSPLATAEWLSPGLAAPLAEPEVPGGATGSFVFPVVLPLDPGPFAETVNVVAGGHWLPPGAATELRGTVARSPAPPAGWESYFTQVTDDRAVAVARADGRIVVFKRHWDGSLRVRRDGGWESLAGRSVRIGAAIDGQGRAWVFSRDNDEVVRARGESAPGGPFGDYIALGGPIAGAPAPVREVHGRISLLATGADGQLRWRRQTGSGFTDWQILFGDRLGPPAAARNADGRIEVVAIGPDGGLRGRRQLTAGGELGDWYVLGGGAAGTPALVLGHDGRMIAVVAGTDGKLRARRQAAPGGAWAGAWEELGGSGLSMPAAVRNADGRVEVFARGAGGLQASVQTVPGGAFGALSSLGGPVGDPAVVLGDDGRLMVLVAGSDGGLSARRQAAAGDWDGEHPGRPSLGGVQVARHATLGVDTLLRPRPEPVEEEE